MAVNAAVIPVAGLGTRLLPLTKSVPKELLPLGRKPVLQHVVEEMQAAGAQKLVMITSESKETIKEHFSVDTELEKKLLDQGKNDLLDALQFLSDPAHIICVNQAQQKGLGDAVYCARESIGDQSFLIALGDTKMGDTKMGDDMQRGGDHSKFSDQNSCLLYTSPSPRDRTRSRMPSSA